MLTLTITSVVLESLSDKSLKISITLRPFSTTNANHFALLQQPFTINLSLATTVRLLWNLRFFFSREICTLLEFSYRSLSVIAVEIIRCLVGLVSLGSCGIHSTISFDFCCNCGCLVIVIYEG